MKKAVLREMLEANEIGKNIVEKKAESIKEIPKQDENIVLEPKKKVIKTRKSVK